MFGHDWEHGTAKVIDRRMRGTRALLVILLVAFCAALASAPLATAKPRPKPKPAAAGLLPKRSCQGLLDLADFPGAIGEGETLEPRPTFYGSLCSFTPPEPTEAEPEPGGFGFDVLDVFTRKAWMPFGKPINLLTDVLSARPEGTQSVIHLQGIGTRAELVINDEGETAGLLQVRNDGFAVYPESAAGIRGMLVRVAHELSAGGK
jgi:hypothetical protein